MRADYKQWLERQKYQAATIQAQIYRVQRVEEYHGDLDEHYAQDRMASLIEALRYSTDDQRRNRPNPSKIPIEGNIRNNLASYRDAVKRYREFRDSGDVTETSTSETRQAIAEALTEEDLGQRIGLERDMQAALRLNLEQLEAGLTAIDDGAERSVDSGFIDITAHDSLGSVVVIELKAGAAGQRAIAQILSYMGDISAEEENSKVRGILVASEFDAKAKAAAKMVPNLALRKYSIRFFFSEGHD
ncbi:MAG: endonuclease NucS domain-containing protein [Terriglobales bacterium]